MDGKGMALVLGATGGAGGEITRALLRDGWSVRALARHPPQTPSGINWVAGDATKRGDVLSAAKGARVIVHAVNPPGYRNWGALVLPMLENTIAAAEENGARIALPGTVYNYGPDAGTVVSESSRQNPQTRKGKLRVAMEQRRAQAAAAGRARGRIVRAGDFFGPRPGNNWFSQGLVKPGKPVSSIVYPGPFEIGHSWAYLPDVGETFARLLDRESALEPFSSFHLRGHWLEPGIEMASAIRRVLGRTRIPIRKLPWFLLRLAAPLNETLREMMEMRYLWFSPLRLENAKLVTLLGEEPCTPLDEAVATTLKGLGCS
jgi:nucleoside-diphosphate-sugar epimerase